jgi:rare lipoprotein A
MYSVISDNPSFVEIGADKPDGSCANIRKAVRLFAATLTAATLAACAQSSVMTDKVAVSQQPLPDPPSKASLVTNRRAAAVTRNAASVAKKDGAQTHDASYGLASYYSHESPTASGEKFNPRELTAAHRTLPFGTRVRVTNIATGQSVTVRVNDRGPFVPGRIVDVSHSAAESLGIVERGVAKVKLNVVE